MLRWPKLVMRGGRHSGLCHCCCHPFTSPHNIKNRLGRSRASVAPQTDDLFSPFIVSLTPYSKPIAHPPSRTRPYPGFRELRCQPSHTDQRSSYKSRKRAVLPCRKSTGRGRESRLRLRYQRAMKTAILHPPVSEWEDMSIGQIVPRSARCQCPIQSCPAMLT